MLIVQIYVIRSKFLQGFLALRFNEFGVTTNDELGSKFKFCCEEYLVAVSSACRCISRIWVFGR
jgi:hypothetical protein